MATLLHQFVYIQTGLIVTSCEIEEFLQASRWGRVDRLLQLHHFANGWGDCQFSQQEQTSSIRYLVGLTALDDQIEHVASFLATEAVEAIVVRVEGEAIIMAAQWATGIIQSVGVGADFLTSCPVRAEATSMMGTAL